MPFDREQGARHVDNGDDMAALMGHSDPSLTHTFHLEMTPHSFPASGNTATVVGSKPSLSSGQRAPPLAPAESTAESSMPAKQSRTHAKRRDPSYIPRPPNAFILFRSAFIRDQNIPGKVEGNHSKLSKIIGLCWKQLPPEEKEKWEARAVNALAEHRARYPDWRFRPGANARLKVSEAGISTQRRRSVRSRAKGSPAKEGDDGEIPLPDGREKDKGKGKLKMTRMPSIEETRCAKIAGFVAEGLKGEELGVAVRQWEDDRRIPRFETRAKKPRSSKPRPTSSKTSRSQSDATVSSLPSIPPKKSPSDSESDSLTPTHTQTTRTPIVGLTKYLVSSSETNISEAHASTTDLPAVPLTHMFRRSLSAPTPNKRSSYPHSFSEPSDESSAEDIPPTSAEPSPGAWGSFNSPVPEEAPTGTHTSSHIRRVSASYPISSSCATAPFDPDLTWQGPDNRRRAEQIQPPSSWWTGQKDQGSCDSTVFAADNLGYETQAGGGEYDREYLEQYRSYESFRDGGRHVEWTDEPTASNTNQRLVTVIEDPYKDDCGHNSPLTLSQPETLSLPPPSSGAYYYSTVPPTSPSPFPSSSYSALSGWDGDYKPQQASMRSWPESHPLPNAPHTSSSTVSWYSDQELYNWTGTRPELQHTVLSVDPHDWDRHERRASSDMNLRVEPQRQLNFDDELRRLHGGS